MFTLEQTEGLIEDIFRTELVKQRRDVLAFFDTAEPICLDALSPQVRQEATRLTGAFFAFEPAPFASLQELALQACKTYEKNQAVYLSTSGSTGAPKQVRYTREMLEIEGACVGGHFQTAKRLITLTPRQHLYGLSFAVMFASCYHIPAVAMAPLPLQPWHTLLQAGDVVAGFPLFWEYFLRAGHTFPAGVTAVTSTAPCPKGLFERLQKAGAQRVLELYGATETGGIGVRDKEDAPFVINDYWELAQGVPPRLRRKGIEGWVDFPDEVQFVPPRGIFPLRRMDRLVQVAGVNVSLERVEKVILQYPAVKACRVRLMRPEEGQRLKAFLVLQERHTAAELPQLRQFLLAKLSSHEMPRAFTIGTQLPVGPMGKASDW